MTIRFDVEKHCTENVWVLPALAGHTEPTVGIVELDTELEVLLDDILNGDRRSDDDASRLREFVQQCRRIALDRLGGKVGNGFVLIDLSSASASLLPPDQAVTCPSPAEPAGLTGRYP